MLGISKAVLPFAEELLMLKYLQTLPLDRYNIVQLFKFWKWWNMLIDSKDVFRITVYTTAKYTLSLCQK